MEVRDVNRLIKQFREVQKLMKMMQKTGGKVGEVVWVGEKRPWRFPDVPRLKLFLSFFFSTFC
jgi:signal recognition particle GTPase